MMKIYTKTGDQGNTSLFGGTKISKDNIQIEAYGTVDELNSFLGLLISQITEKDIATFLKSIQPLLFDIGSHLASDGKSKEYLPNLDDTFALKFEKEIDKMSEKLPVLKSFIMPGGNLRIAYAHICRTVCRRAERRCVSLSHLIDFSPEIIIILNRASDYFFALARYLCLIDQIDEVKWNPKS